MIHDIEHQPSLEKHLFHIQRMCNLFENPYMSKPPAPLLNKFLNETSIETPATEALRIKFDFLRLPLSLSAEQSQRDLVFELNQALVHPFDVLNLLLWSIRRLGNLAIQNFIFSIILLEVLCSLQRMAGSAR